MSELTPAATIVRSPEQVSGNIDGQVVLLGIENGTYYNMNKVGSRIWALIERPTTVAALTEQLLGEFEVERSTCEKEVADFLRQLQQANLLKVSGSGGISESSAGAGPWKSTRPFWPTNAPQ